MIASMASLISYRFLIAAYPEEKRRYTMYFTVVNLGFLLGFSDCYVEHSYLVMEKSVKMKEK